MILPLTKVFISLSKYNKVLLDMEFSLCFFNFLCIIVGGYIYVICKLAGHISHNCLRRSCTHRWAGGDCVPPLAPVDTLQGWGHAPRLGSEHTSSGWQQRPERSSPSPRCLAAAGANQPGSWWVAVAAGEKHPGSRYLAAAGQSSPVLGARRKLVLAAKGKEAYFCVNLRASGL